MARARSIVKNAAEVRRILQASDRVLAVFQGHHHEGDYALLMAFTTTP